MKPIIIAKAGGIDIFADKNSSFSFFASPYQAHRDYAAVDICQNKKFGATALSPVSGEVIKTLKFESPTVSGKSLPEYLILIKSGENIARIMHLEPKVKTGDKIAVGDEIGRFINNGFFSYWVDPIIHLEVRKPNDFLRARGGLELEPFFENKETKPAQKITGEVLEANPRNVTVKLDKEISASINEKSVILDGATNIDYSGVFGLFEKGETVLLGTTKLGVITGTGAHASLLRTEPLYIFVNNIPFGGVHFIPSSNEVKLLPKKYGETSLKIGEKVAIKIENASC